MVKKKLNKEDVKILESVALFIGILNNENLVIADKLLLIEHLRLLPRFYNSTGK